MKNWNDRIKQLWDMTKSTPLASVGTPVGRIKVKTIMQVTGDIITL